jgi:hypothetical protein
MSEFTCPNIYYKPDRSGGRNCKINDNDIEKLKKQVSDLETRLFNAKEVYRHLKPKADREAVLDEALREVYDRLRRMRITKGAFIHDVKDDLEKTKEIIVKALNC